MALGQITCTIERWQRIVTLWYMTKGNFPDLKGHGVMPRVHRSRWNLMTWVDPKRIYTTKATLGFKRNPKESAWATNIRCTLLSQLSLGIIHELLVEWVFFSNVQVRNLEDSPLFLYIFFNNHKRVRVPFQNPNLKAKLVIPWSTWAFWVCNVVRGKRAMKERIREAQRVFMDYIE